MFSVADITGAFMAGLVLSGIKRSNFVASKFDVLSYLYLSPIFFASIGAEKGFASNYETLDHLRQMKDMSAIYLQLFSPTSLCL